MDFTNIFIGLFLGAISGALFGMLISLLGVWAKDIRDARLRSRGEPLPKDRVYRVFPVYCWFFVIENGLIGTLIGAFV